MGKRSRSRGASSAPEFCSPQRQEKIRFQKTGKRSAERRIV